MSPPPGACEGARRLGPGYTPAPMHAPEASGPSLEDRVAALPWYHTLELPGGVVTRGEYDLRPAVRHAPIPPSLSGRRCLDVGTRDGFWAFEMERRGAAEVVGIDLDDPLAGDFPEPRPRLTTAVVDRIRRRDDSFRLAHSALGSRVEWRNLSVYDLGVEGVGHFDLAVIGTLLHHLRDPVGALMAIRRVLDGVLVVSATFSVPLSVLHPRTPVAAYVVGQGPFWEIPNMSALRRQVTAAGYTVEAVGRPYLQRYGAGPGKRPSLRPSSRLLRHPASTLALRFGVPHVFLLARPRP